MTFAEKDSEHSLDYTLTDCKAKGLIYAPDASVGEGETRNDFVQNLMPELKTMYFGDALKV